MSSTHPAHHSKRAAFFYGTLMAPAVLRRVTNRRTSSPNVPKPPLSIRPALLPGFRRHRVQFCDYPAIAPVDESNGTDASTSTIKNTSNEVRGTYVTGLTSDDIKRLDAFEGGEYERRVVRVRLLPVEGEQSGIQEEKEKKNKSEEEWADAETYVWIADPEDLEDAEWDFDVFVRKKLSIWAGGKADSGFEDAARVEADRLHDENEHGGVDTTRGRSVIGGEFEQKVNDLDD